MLKKIDSRVWIYTLIAIMAALTILHWSTIWSLISRLFSVAAPLIYGAALAYVLNILMALYEKFIFPKAKSGRLVTARRGLSLGLAIITVLAVVILVLGLVIPQLITVVVTFIDDLPIVFGSFQNLLDQVEQWAPQVTQEVENMDLDWSEITSKTMSFLNTSSSNLVTSTVSAISSLSSAVINGFLALMIAIYILMSKEKLGSQFKRLLRTFLSDNYYDRFFYVTGVADKAFHNFITGEVLEAIILGSLVTIGMWILRLPYASVIGILTGVLALIPILGAYISAGIGMVLIGVESPTQMLIFLAFIIVIQQFEGNFIYPKVVGYSLGLPGLWVLVSVTIGGGLLGIPGMLLGVPMAATTYMLLKNHVQAHEKKEGLDPKI